MTDPHTAPDQSPDLPAHPAPVILTEPAPVELGTLQAATPSALIAGASEMATALAALIQAQGLATTIQGREYVRVEGWTTLATMLGVIAREVHTTEEAGIYTATVELIRIRDGAVISRASAECGDERPWNARPRYARRSMAQTRATGKACRLAFSWIMRLAGYEPTPAEEMPTERELAQERAREIAEMLPGPITPVQHKHLEARIRELGLNRDRVKAWVKRRWNVDHLPDLNAAQLSDLSGRLAGFAEKQRREAQEDANHERSREELADETHRFERADLEA